MSEYSYCIILCPFTLRREGEETRANLKEMERDLERANSILSTDSDVTFRYSLSRFFLKKRIPKVVASGDELERSILLGNRLERRWSLTKGDESGQIFAKRRHFHGSKERCILESWIPCLPDAWIKIFLDKNPLYSRCFAVRDDN